MAVFRIDLYVPDEHAQRLNEALKDGLLQETGDQASEYLGVLPGTIYAAMVYNPCEDRNSSVFTKKE